MASVHGGEDRNLIDTDPRPSAEIAFEPVRDDLLHRASAAAGVPPVPRSRTVATRRDPGEGQENRAVRAIAASFARLAVARLARCWGAGPLRAGAATGPRRLGWRGCVAALLLALLAACARERLPPPAAEEGARVPLLLVRHAWHTGLVVPATAFPETSPFRAAFPGADWLELGWGDRLFYPHPDPSLATALRAALWPTPSTLALAAHRGPAETVPGEELWLLEVGAAAVERLHARALATLELDAQGRPIPVAAGRRPNELFWASSEPFHLLRTCNRWTAELLRAAGLPVEPVGIVTAGDLLRQLEPFARRIRRRRARAGSEPARASRGRGGPRSARRRAAPGGGGCEHDRDTHRGEHRTENRRQKQPEKHRGRAPLVPRHACRAKR